MSKVFRVNRKEIEIEYEFLDGKSVILTATQLSTKESEAFSEKLNDNGIEAIKLGIKKMFKRSDAFIVEKIIDEQFEEGDLLGFWIEINKLFEEEKAKK